MRKIYTLTFGLLFVTTLLSSQNLYWVGGTGSWDDASHWSEQSGGAAGNNIPTELNHVFIDQNSLSNGDVISITSDISINTLIINTKNLLAVSLNQRLLFYWKAIRSIKPLLCLLKTIIVQPFINQSGG